MSEVEFLILNLFIIFPFQILIWSCFKLPFMFLKFIYGLIKPLVIKGYNYFKNKK